MNVNGIIESGNMVGVVLKDGKGAEFYGRAVI